MKILDENYQSGLRVKHPAEIEMEKKLKDAYKEAKDSGKTFVSIKKDEDNCEIMAYDSTTNTYTLFKHLNLDNGEYNNTYNFVNSDGIFKVTDTETCTNDNYISRYIITTECVHPAMAYDEVVDKDQNLTLSEDVIKMLEMFNNFVDVLSSHNIDLDKYNIAGDYTSEM